MILYKEHISSFETTPQTAYQVFARVCLAETIPHEIHDEYLLIVDVVDRFGDRVLVNHLFTYKDMAQSIWKTTTLAFITPRYTTKIVVRYTPFHPGYVEYKLPTLTQLFLVNSIEEESPIISTLCADEIRNIYHEILNHCTK
jgi:hypothetical protein